MAKWTKDGAVPEPMDDERLAEALKQVQSTLPSVGVDLKAHVERLRARVAELEEDSEVLAALRAAGVDNWGGWDHAMSLLNEDEEDDDA